MEQKSAASFNIVLSNRLEELSTFDLLSDLLPYIGIIIFVRTGYDNMLCSNLRSLVD